MRFKDVKQSQKVLAKIPGPWLPGYYALLNGWRKKNAANLSKTGKK